MSSTNIVDNVASVINSQSDIPDPITKDSNIFANSDPSVMAGFAEEKRKAELESYRQDTQERKKYAKLIFWMVALWLAGIFAIILMVGFQSVEFTLTNEVTIALITTTTINVAAFFLAVTKYLFPNSGRD